MRQGRPGGGGLSNSLSKHFPLILDVCVTTTMESVNRSRSPSLKYIPISVSTFNESHNSFLQYLQVTYYEFQKYRLK